MLSLRPQDKMRFEAVQQAFLNDVAEAWQSRYRVLFRHFSVEQPSGTATVMLLQPIEPIDATNLYSPPINVFSVVMDRWHRADETVGTPQLVTENTGGDNEDVAVLLMWPYFIPPLDVQSEDELKMLRYAFVEAIAVTLQREHGADDYSEITRQMATVATQWCQLLRQLLE
jgi:hypothetical protein